MFANTGIKQRPQILYMYGCQCWIHGRAPEAGDNSEAVTAAYWQTAPYAPSFKATFSHGTGNPEPQL